MAYAISDDCISCGACLCQNARLVLFQRNDEFVIDADTCIECGACEATCPVGAPAQA